MRPLFVIVIWIVLIGGLTLYMESREAMKPPPAFHSQDAQASGLVALEAVISSDLAPDPFALQTDPNEKPAAFLIRLNGKEILRRGDRVPAGAVLRKEPLVGLVQGRNEFYVEANPPLTQAFQPLAVRVRVLRDGQPIADTSLWSELGSKTAGTFLVEIEPARTSEEGRHGQ